MDTVAELIHKYLNLHQEWLKCIDEQEFAEKLDSVLIALLLQIDIALMSQDDIRKAPEATQWLLEKTYVYDLSGIDKSATSSNPQELVRELFEDDLLAPLVDVLDTTDSAQRELICSILLRCIIVGGIGYVKAINEYGAIPTLVRLYSSEMTDSEAEEEEEDSIDSPLGPDEALPFNLLMLLCGFNVHSIVANRPEPVAFLRPVLEQLNGIYVSNPRVIDILIDRLDPHTMSHAAFAAFLFLLDQFAEIMSTSRRFKKTQYLDIVRKCEVYIRIKAEKKPLELIYLSFIIRDMGHWMLECIEHIPLTMFDEHLFTSLTAILDKPGYYALAHHALGVLIICTRYFPHYRHLVGATTKTQTLASLLKKTDRRLVDGAIELLNYLLTDDANNHLATLEVILTLTSLLSDDMTNKRIGEILKLFKLIAERLPYLHAHFKTSGLVDYLICPVLGERNDHQSTAMAILKLLKVDEEEYMCVL